MVVVIISMIEMVVTTINATVIRTSAPSIQRLATLGRTVL
jgi:hypothetical protein